MIDKFYSLFLYLVIFLIPFTGMKGISFLGELSGEAHVLPLMACIVIGFFYFYNYLPNLNKSNITILLAFAISVVITLFSISDISEQTVFKGHSGIGRFFSQSFVLLLYSLFSCSVYLYTKKAGRKKIIEIISGSTWFSFVTVVIFSLIEAPYVLGYDFTKSILDLYSTLFRAEDYIDYLRRMRSVSFEAPSLAMFLPLPLIVAYTLDVISIKKKAFISFFVVVLIILTFSRTALVVVFVLLLLYLYFKALNKNIINKLLIHSNFLIIFSFILALDALFDVGVASAIADKVMSMAIDSDDNYHLASNLGRWGAQVGAVNIGLDNIYFGVGLGQSGFYLPHYYPDWAFGSYQVRNWASPSDPLWPPVFSLYTRIFSELGLIGIILLLYFFFKLVIKLRHNYMLNIGPRNEVLFLLISLIYSFLIFAQFASFRFVYFWLILAVVLQYFESLREKN